MFSNEGIKTWPNQRTRNSANRHRQQNPLPCIRENKRNETKHTEHAANRNRAQTSHCVGDPSTQNLQQQRHDLRKRKEQPDLRDRSIKVFQIKRHQRAVHAPADICKDHRR